MKKIESLVKKKQSQIMIFVALDLLFLMLASLLALELRFDFGVVPMEYMKALGYAYIVDSIIMLIVFLGLKLYTSVWRYASVTELLNVIYGCIILEISSYFFHHLFHIALPRSFFFIRISFMILFVGSMRFSYRILRTIYTKFEKKGSKKNVMIIGAGAAGKLLIDELYGNKNAVDEKVVCVIDDNPNLKGTYFKNVPVCGGRKSISKNVEKYKVQKIIIAVPSAPKEEIAKIVDECQKTKCEINILPSIYSSLNRDIAKKIRPLSYEDFLGRNQIIVNNSEIMNNIKDKIVLVTGGGGSIGSELCRQIASASPKKLIIFDIYENNAYEIQQNYLEIIQNLIYIQLLEA